MGMGLVAGRQWLVARVIGVGLVAGRGHEGHVIALLRHGSTRLLFVDAHLGRMFLDNLILLQIDEVHSRVVKIGHPRTQLRSVGQRLAHASLTVAQLRFWVGIRSPPEPYRGRGWRGGGFRHFL